MKRLLPELRWRGLLQDMTPGLDERLAHGPITGYVGFDPTADSLQVGNLVPIMLLAHLQRAGGKPLVVMGGGTGLIGDPSGKQSERPLLGHTKIEQNIRRQRSQFRRFLHFDRSRSSGAEVLNNAKWLKPLKLLPFLRKYGKHVPVSLMLQKESVRTRLEWGISYTEFTYMLLQAYDFLHLYQSRRCELQLGGSDQWGNITIGTELIRRLTRGSAHGLCGPLITTSTGAKFGKSEGETVWLDPRKTPPYVFYNFWVNTDDQHVQTYLKMFTFKTQGEIKKLMELHRRAPEKRHPHHALARDIAARVHGKEVAERAQAETQHIFERRRAGQLRPHDISRILQTMPTITFSWDRSSPPTVEELFVAAGLTPSKSETRRLLRQGGLYLNENIEGVPAAQDPLAESTVITAGGRSYILLRRGKKNYRVLLIRFVG